MFLDKEKVLGFLDEVYIEKRFGSYIALKNYITNEKFLTLPKIKNNTPFIYHSKWSKKPIEKVWGERFFNKCKILYLETKSLRQGKLPSGSQVLFRVISGSQAYGLSTPTSDVDVKGVFLASPIELSLNLVPNTVSISKDEIYYELGYFIKLLIKGDTMALEVLFSPDDCIVEMSKYFKKLRNNRHIFLHKDLHYKIYGFAMKQFKKATNYNKMSNWSDERVRRKKPSEFCKFRSSDYGSVVTLESYLKSQNMTDEDISLTRVDGFENTFNVYKLKNDKGWYRENTNELFVSAIPKQSEFLGILYYNHSKFSEHRREFKDYENWLKEMNRERYNLNKEHSQNYDAKNVQHTVRLLMLSLQVPKTLDFDIDMSDHRDYLLDIKKGKLDLKTVLDEWEEKTSNLKSLYDESKLPNEIDLELVNKIYKDIRYKL